MVFDDGRVVAAVEGFQGLLQPGRFLPELLRFLLQGQGGGAGAGDGHGEGDGGDGGAGWVFLRVPELGSWGGPDDDDDDGLDGLDGGREQAGGDKSRQGKLGVARP